MKVEHSPEQRDAARGNTRGRFEQWAKNPACEANTISAVRNIRMDHVAKAAGLETSFGQSPFAIARGDQFERNLFWDDAAGFIDELVAADVLPEGAEGLLDLRLRMNGGPRVKTLDAAIAETSALLTEVASTPLASRSGLPVVLAAATVRIPRGVMLPEAVLIIDALVLRLDLAVPRLIVGEVKTYPDRGGHTDAGELAGARAQAGLYVHALDVVAEQLGLSDGLDISRTGMLVLSRPGSNRPSIRAAEDLRFQAERARRGFDLLEDAAQALPDDVWANPDGEPATELTNLVATAATSYAEGCSSFCDLAPRCYDQALAAGDPSVLGHDVARFLGGIDLHRAVAMLEGASPANPAEADLVRRVSQSDSWTQA